MGIVVRGQFCRKSGPTITDSIISECLQLDQLAPTLEPKGEYLYQGWDAFLRDLESGLHSAFKSYPATGTGNGVSRRFTMRDIASR